MPFISLLGSSHVSERHLLPSIFIKIYDGMDVSFKKKYMLHTAKGIPGGQLANHAVINELVSVAQETCKQPGYHGQVLVLLVGTRVIILPVPVN